MKTPPFVDLVEVTLEGGEIVLTCTACSPPQVIAKFVGKTTLNLLILAASNHDKER